MLRNILQKSVTQRIYSFILIRQNNIESCDLKTPEDSNADICTPQNRNSNQLIKEMSTKPVTSMPFSQFNFPSQNSESSKEIAEFVETLAPPLPVSFNLAAYVNQSESLQKLVQLGVNLSILEQKPNKAKYVLKLDFERDMKTHIQFLHDHGVNADFLGRFITKNPFIFKATLENLEIRLNYLKSKKFSNEAITRIISDNPYFLTTDTKAVDSRLGFFQKQFSLTGNQVRYLITKNPKLVSYNFDKFREKLFVMKEVLGFNGNEMKQILLKKPKVWIIGRSQLTERFYIVHNDMGISHERIKAFPDVLLTREFILKQRHQYLVHLKRAQYNPKLPLFISLQDLATTTDAVFCERCAKTSVEEFNKFLRAL